jgi:hypothetical protein
MFYIKVLFYLYNFITDLLPKVMVDEYLFDLTH